MTIGPQYNVLAPSAESEWFSGHFPGDPILPGIAQLEMVAGLLGTEQHGEMQLTGLRRVKFRKLVRPGELLNIQTAPGNKPGHYSFRITSSNEQEVCSGQMVFSEYDRTVVDS
jgi:3-hydroxyacyl-[acyl-carrier-protein] dehydratase